MGATESGVFALVGEVGIELELGSAVPWMTNRGHLNPVLQGSVPADTLNLLRMIYQRLGGDERALAGKRPGSSPRPDFFFRSAALIIEVDEVQHFTSDRLLTLELYPANVQLGFGVDEYRALIRRWSSIADRYRAGKPAVDLPHIGGRRAQRAYFDALRDLVAPAYGWSVLRVPAPECDATAAAIRLVDRLARG